MGAFVRVPIPSDSRQVVNGLVFQPALLLGGLVLVGSAIADLAIAGDGQGLTAFLRIVVGAVNLVAWVQLRQQSGAPRTAEDSAGPPQGRETRKGAWEIPSVAVGQAAAVPFFLAPFVIEFTGNVHDAADIAIVIAAGALLLVALAATLGFLLSKAGSLGLVAGGAVALLPAFAMFEFWYATYYQPAHQRPRVNIAAKLEEAGRHGDVSHMLASVTLKNEGSGELEFLDAVYTVTGFDVTPRDRPLTAADVYTDLADGPTAPFQDSAGYEGMLQVGRLVRHGGHITPGQEITNSFAFDVRNDGERKLRLTVLIAVISHGESDLEKAPGCGRTPPQADICTQLALPRASLLRYVLADSPAARVYFIRPTPETPYGRLRTDFVPVDLKKVEHNAPAEVQRLDPYLMSRGFTSSVEFRLAPYIPPPLPKASPAPDRDSKKGR